MKKNISHVGSNECLETRATVYRAILQSGFYIYIPTVHPPPHTASTERGQAVTSCLKPGHKFVVILLDSRQVFGKRGPNDFTAMILGALANCQLH